MTTFTEGEALVEDLATIIPLLGKSESFREWHTADSGMDWETYQQIMGHVEEAVYWSSVFVPEFVEQNGMVLRRRQYLMVSTDESPDESPYLSALARTQSEYITNHLHISDLFFNDPHKAEYDERVYLYIANVIADCWRRQLHERFPAKEFTVGVGEDGGDLAVYVVTVRDDT